MGFLLFLSHFSDSSLLYFFFFENYFSNKPLKPGKCHSLVVSAAFEVEAGGSFDPGIQGQTTKHSETLSKIKTYV